MVESCVIGVTTPIPTKTPGYTIWDCGATSATKVNSHSLTTSAPKSFPREIPEEPHKRNVQIDKLTPLTKSKIPFLKTVKPNQETNQSSNPSVKSQPPTMFFTRSLINPDHTHYRGAPCKETSSACRPNKGRSSRPPVSTTGSFDESSSSSSSDAAVHAQRSRRRAEPPSRMQPEVNTYIDKQMRNPVLKCLASYLARE